MNESTSLTWDEAVENKSNPTLFDIIFSTIVVLAAGFSGYTTYLGFSYDLPVLASIVIATIIGLGLLIINFKIREHRIKGDGVGKPLIAFSIFLIFSFISNTNAIYTYFLANDIVGKTQVNAWESFDEGTSAILAVLDKHDSIVEREQVKQQLVIARKNLIDQISDPANPGMGEKAQRHLAEVESILDVKTTRLQPPSGSASHEAYVEYANTLDVLIITLFDEKYQSGKSAEIELFREKINGLRNFYSEKVILKEYSSDTTDLMYNDLKSLQVEAEKLVESEVHVPVINVTADDIGSFQYTWTNFIDGIAIPAIILSILLSLMLDILAPLLSLLLYKHEVEY